jgi:serine/threonine protein kinase
LCLFDSHLPLCSDIKSQNILLSDAGVAKVADFGLAKIRNSTLASTTHRGGAPGTPFWSAPEVLAARVAGQSGREKADMYSFAVLCSEILTGQLPYADSDWDEHELRRHVAEGQRPDLPRGNLPGGLVDLVKKSWAANPDERPSFAQFILDLEAALSDQTTGNRARAEAPRQVRQCMICLENPRNAKLRPCDHAVTCYECSLQLMERGRQVCPVCRAVFSEVRRGTFYESYCPE